MRINEETAAYHSIIWFACDINGRIMLADSNEGCIPDFVAMDQERAELLANKLCGLQAVDRGRIPPVDYDLLASKGFYCYLNDDPYDGKLYRLRARPQNPILLDSLDDEMRRLLSKQELQIDLELCDHFSLTP